MAKKSGVVEQDPRDLLSRVRNLVLSAEVLTGDAANDAWLAAKDEEDEDDEEENRIVLIASTERANRHKYIVRTNGIGLSNYRKVPVLLWGHDHDQPIGTSRVRRDEATRRLLVSPRFAGEEQANPTGEKVRRMVRDGFLNAVSISFLPEKIKFRHETSEEEWAKENAGDARLIVTKSDLLEISIVSVPANPDAIRMAASLGLELPGFDSGWGCGVDHDEIMGRVMLAVDEKLKGIVEELKTEIRTDLALEKVKERLESFGARAFSREEK